MQTAILKQLILSQLGKLKKVNLKSARQKKIIAASVFIIILALAYFLTLNTRQHLSQDTLYWEGRAALAKNLLAKFKSEEVVLHLLKQQARNSQRIIRLPQGQDIVQAAEEYAQRMNIRIINTKSKATHTIVIDSRDVQVYTVEIKAEAGFVNLMRYFNMLYRITPDFVSVDRLKVSRDAKNQDKLNVQAELKFYHLSS